MKSTITFLLIILFSFILVNSCDLFCEEEEFQNYENLHNLTHWTVDTLDIPGVEDMYLRTIWGSSSDDVYIVGSSSEGITGAVWHYDGNEWSPVPLDSFQGGFNHGTIWVQDIWGFAKDDVYITGVRWTQDDDFVLGTQCFLIHFDGSEWTEIEVDNSGCVSIGGTGPHDIWLGGFQVGNLSHWNGDKWKSYNDIFPEEVYYGMPSFEYITKSSYEKTYAILNNYSTFPFLVSTTGEEWEIEGTFSAFNYYKLNLTDDGTLYACGSFNIPLLMWNNGVWENIIIEDNFSPGAMVNLDNDNQLIAGSVQTPWQDDQGIHFNFEFKVYHYNGSEFIPLEIQGLTDTPYGIWSDGNEIFIASFTVFSNEENKPHKTTIIHGR